MNANRYYSLAAGGVLSLFPGTASNEGMGKENEEKPNVIIIYADDLDFDETNIYENTKFPCYNGMKELGIFRPDKDDTASSHFENMIFLPKGEMAWYDDPVMYMPVIGEMASRGAVFNRFYVTSSISTPSRYSMLTGRYASKSNGVVNQPDPGNVMFNSYILPEEGTIAKEMKKYGYETGFIGKWHNGLPELNQMTQASRTLRNGDPEDPEIKKIYQGYYNRSVDYLKQNTGFDVVDRLYANNKESLPLPQKMRVHNLEWLTEGAVEFIKKDRDKPFFLYMALTLPHGRYYSTWIKDDPLATPAGMLKERPKYMPERQEIIELLKSRGIDTRNAIATLIDFSMSALMNALKEEGVDKNTVIIFTSDHQSRGKNTCYEVCRVPMFVWWGDKIKPGTRVDEICANIDITSTVVDLAGGKVSADNPQDGRSFVPWLLGKGSSVESRKALLLECGFSRAVVTQRYKYLVNRPPENIMKIMNDEAEICKQNGTRRRIGWDGKPNRHPAFAEPGIWFYADRDFPYYFDTDQVYNLENDVFEQHNIVDTKKGKRVLPELKKLMSDLMKDMSYEFGEFKK